MPQEQQLKVIEFTEKNITPVHDKQVINRILFPYLYIDEINHNKKAVKHRFSITSLTGNIKQICNRLYHQITPNHTLLKKTEALLDRN